MQSHHSFGTKSQNALMTRAQLHTFHVMYYFLFWVVWLRVRFVPLFTVVPVALRVRFEAWVVWLRVRFAPLFTVVPVALQVRFVAPRL